MLIAYCRRAHHDHELEANRSCQLPARIQLAYADAQCCLSFALTSVSFHRILSVCMVLDSWWDYSSGDKLRIVCTTMPLRELSSNVCVRSEVNSILMYSSHWFHLFIYVILLLDLEHQSSSFSGIWCTQHDENVVEVEDQHIAFMITFPASSCYVHGVRYSITDFASGCIIFYAIALNRFWPLSDCFQPNPVHLKGVRSHSVVWSVRRFIR